MPKKPVKKAAPSSLKKPTQKVVAKPARRSPREKADEAMAVVLQATGLSQLKPIHPSRKTAIKPKSKPKSL